VLELGSGCGLVGIVAWLLGAQVLLTDLSPVVQRVLSVNVEQVKRARGNPPHGDEMAAVDCTSYVWGEDKGILHDGHGGYFDVILGSDIVYELQGKDVHFGHDILMRTITE